MEPTETLAPPTAEQIEQYHTWWGTLSDPWKRAFNEVMLRRTAFEMPDDQTLHQIAHSEALRFAGPTAPYPNMAFELEDLSGLAALDKSKILVVTFHKLTNLREIAHLTQITSLFVYNNYLSSLEGIEGMHKLQELYFNVNDVSSLLPLANLTNLQTIYCNYNKITSLDGIGEQHRSNLRAFYCLPNDQLPQSEVIRMEQQIGIRCMKA